MCASKPDIIAHALRCDHMSRIPHGSRHSFLKFALANVARSYGVGVQIEPNYYVYPDSDILHRPDLTFLTSISATVTDVTIVSPATEAGVAARRAADVKSKHHTPAANIIGHEFIPFAMETTGTFDKRCFELFRKLGANVPRYATRRFQRDLHGAATVAVAQFRAMAVRNACTSIGVIGALSDD